MSNNVHSSLPVEYQLKYGTARGNAQLGDFVNKTPVDSLLCIESGLTQKVALGLFLGDTSPLGINTLDAGLVCSNGIKPLR